MSFYRRQPPAMGFAWVPAAIQLVGGALQSHPIDSELPPSPESSPVIPILVAIGSLGLVGGLLYLVWRA